MGKRELNYKYTQRLRWAKEDQITNILRAWGGQERIRLQIYLEAEVGMRGLNYKYTQGLRWAREDQTNGRTGDLVHKM